MRIRLRPKHSPEAIAEFYREPYDHTKWAEHKARVEWTIRRLNHFITLNNDITRVVDLSCGDGAILDGLHTPLDKVYGDMIFTERLDVIGNIEDTVKLIDGDLLICSETLEHLDDPDAVLRDAARNFKWIAITTPLGEKDDGNWEHYWGWDMLDLSEMLKTTQWSTRVMETLPLTYYTYQFWIARSTWG